MSLAGALGAALGLLVTTIAAASLATEGSALIDAPAPPTLPALAHARSTLTLEFTGASVAPSAPQATGGGGRATAWFTHAELEAPLQPRVWYVGAAADTVSAAVPGLRREYFFSNPELWARGLWSSLVGLSAGAGFGLVLPLPRDLSPAQVDVLQTVRVVRPWDAAYFADRTLTLRPWFDVRHIAWRFIFQFRQGLDASVVARDLRRSPIPASGAIAALPQIASLEHRLDLLARATFYVGFRASDAIGLGLEMWEVYALTADVADDKRAAFAVSPSVRLMLGRVAPAFSVLLPLTTPLRGEASSYYAVRFNVGFDFDFGKRDP